MISSEVQRTLVKSPPELWAEISDPESLARHLGEFGEIRITRVQPEKQIEWEAADASGTVVIKPSGWGTKVKLTVSRELSPTPPNDGAGAGEEAAGGATPALDPDGQAGHDEPQSARDEVEPHPAEELLAEAEPEALAEPEAEILAEPEAGMPAEPQAEAPAEPEAEAAAEPEAEAEAPETARRRGFFARIFRRGRRNPEGSPSHRNVESERDLDENLEADAGTTDLGTPARAKAAALAEEEPVETEPEAQLRAGDSRAAAAQLRTPGGGEPVAGNPADVGGAGTEKSGAHGEEAGADARPDLAAQLLAAEEAATEQVTAVLTSVLDRLGAAHHRPFSRA